MAGLLVPFFVVVACASAKQPFAGTWDTLYAGGGTGTVKFTHIPYYDGVKGLRELGGTPCRPPTDYFGVIYDTDEPDTGFGDACTVGSGCIHLKGVYHTSTSSGVSGTFSILSTSALSWTGRYSISGGSGGAWAGSVTSRSRDEYNTPCAAQQHKRHKRHKRPHKRH